MHGKKQVSNASLSDATPWAADTTFGDVLLEPTVIYVKQIMTLLQKVDLKVGKSTWFSNSIIW